MNDPRFLRGEPDKARQGIQDRGGRYLPVLERFYGLDAEHRSVLKEVEVLRARRNEVSKAVGQAKAKQDEAAAQKLMEEVGGIKKTLPEKEARLEALSSEIRDSLLSIPNLPDASAPVGKSEADNPVVRENGKPRELSFKALDHTSLGERLGILDLPLGAKLAGARFAVLRGAGARLERALAQFMLDTQTRKNGYLEHWVPALVLPEVLEGTGQLPKFEADLYQTGQSTEDAAGAAQVRFLIPTAEAPLTNIVRGEILDAAKLPLKVTALTPCFRQESGSYGKDVRGLIRNHQFDKVELVWITKPEDSPAALEQLTRDAESVLELLGLPFRTIELCTADIGFSSRKTYDLEVWFPGEGRFREVSSCSNCGDFQARRMNARFRRGPEAAPEFVHTLNGSGLAVGRVFAAILENFQKEDGTVSIPEVLRPYFGSDILSGV
ncbi:MAG: serine--tRNA ligase [Elusimicrobia bacterium GWA2_69_24]|nr:MAG: serine--tRNA ligase [Elusimicrobia bacterium GWA2_69_24]HBL18588.1 serine--tRNA ligase [Elusimicrobiota bacterium]